MVRGSGNLSVQARQSLASLGGRRWAARCVAALVSLAGAAHAAPVVEPAPHGFGEGVQVRAVAGAALAGLEAVGDANSDSIELRAIDSTLVATLSRQRLEALLPGFGLGGADDGPIGLALTDSGRVLFAVLLNGQRGILSSLPDAIVRYDLDADDLTVFARLDLGSLLGTGRGAPIVHFRGRLLVGVGSTLRSFEAGTNTRVASSSTSTAVSGDIRAIAIDRTASTVLLATELSLLRAPFSTGAMTFTSLGGVSGTRSMAFSDHYGGVSNPGLFLAVDDAFGPRMLRLSVAAVRGSGPVTPATYLTPSFWPIATSASGTIVRGGLSEAGGGGGGSGGGGGGGSGGLTRVRDDSDTRLSFDAWVVDEIEQVTRLARGLIAPDGEPSGWVIDADVIPAWTRFHPASPDAAAWVVWMLLARDATMGDATARATVRGILERYAGLAADGIVPLRSADGIYWHWINPVNGQAKSPWGDSYATMSTMKIVRAASCAVRMYPGDSAIRRAANRIIGNVRNWPAYVQASSGLLYLRAEAAGGPTLTSPSFAYNEGLLFLEQAAKYGGAAGEAAYAAWLDRARWPTATLITGRPVTGDVPNFFQPAFVSQYSDLLVPAFRASPAWNAQMRNLRESNRAWTDANAPRWNTVFSAGTTPTSYNADSLSATADQIAHFPSLMAMGAGTVNPASPGVRRPDAVSLGGAYHAYRVGARVTYKTGASILYRRSTLQSTWIPNSAGLPDVVFGALGLIEHRWPGMIDSVLANALIAPVTCAADLTFDGQVDNDDFVRFAESYNQFLMDGAFRGADLTGDALCDQDDFLLFATAYNELLCPP